MDTLINITRRHALKALSVMSVATTVPATATASTKRTFTPEERMAYHLAEYQRAAEEVDPSIKEWRVIENLSCHESPMPVIVLATRK
jgi:hypothetical protein